MKTQHTPAQWHCNFTHTNKKRVLSEITKDGSTRAIAEFLGDKDAQDVLANARLIAAAPLMYKALKALLQEAGIDENDLASLAEPEAFRQAWDAINAAEGKA